MKSNKPKLINSLYIKYKGTFFINNELQLQYQTAIVNCVISENLETVKAEYISEYLINHEELFISLIS